MDSAKFVHRAAYYAQELLSTFGTGIGEISLIPATGGLFYIELTQKRDADQTLSTSTIWDRKVDGGFPETKVSRGSAVAIVRILYSKLTFRS